MKISMIAPLAALLFIGCNDVEEPGHSHHHIELITTVELSFAAPDADTIMFVWTDPDQSGSPTIDTISLIEGTVYDVTVAFFNGLEDPPEDLTAEIEDEADQHQVFFTGAGVTGPATGTVTDALLEHAYADTDLNGSPVGLQNTMTALTTGSGELIVTLRHLPPENGVELKDDDLADQVATDGFTTIAGENDAQVTLPFEVL